MKIRHIAALAAAATIVGNTAIAQIVDQMPGAQTITVDGRQRQYAVIAPDAPPAGRKLPLVIFFHGAGGGMSAIKRDRWDEKARKEGFVVVGMQGLPVLTDQPSNFRQNPNIWNDGSGRGRRDPAAEDDVDYFDAVVAAVSKAYPIDPERIYVVGHSNGASMTLRLAQERADRIAAFAVLAGGIWTTRPVTRPVPALFMLGELDPIVPLAGGSVRMPFGGHMQDNPPFIDNPTAWSLRNGCAKGETPKAVDGPLMKTLTWSCGVTFDIFHQHGHGWPSGKGAAAPAFAQAVGPNNTAINATDLAWDFLKDKRLTR